MVKSGRFLWLAPLAFWGVYLCWQTGYQSGYQAGHQDGWNTAEREMLPWVRTFFDGAPETSTQPLASLRER